MVLVEQVVLDQLEVLVEQEAQAALVGLEALEVLVELVVQEVNKDIYMPYCYPG